MTTFILSLSPPPPPPPPFGNRSAGLMWDGEECHGGGDPRVEIIESPSSGDRMDDNRTVVLARAQSHGCGAVGVGLVAGRDD